MKKTTSLPLAAALAVALAPVSNAATVYAESFSNSGPSTQLFSTVGWEAYRSTGTLITITGDAFISPINGRPTDLSNTGQVQTSGQTIKGVAIFATSAGSQVLAYTSEYTGSTPLNKFTLDDISLYQGNTATSNYHVALQIGGIWYASPTMGASTTTDSAGFAAGAGLLTLSDFSLSNWAVINFPVVGPSLSLGTQDQALPTGNVIAFGTYIDRPTATTSRFDSYVINATIPEPSGAMLLGASGFLLLLRRRR